MGLNMNPPGLLPGSNEADPGARVLIVDDEGLTRMMIRRVLEDSGYRVLEAQDGQTATRLCDAEQPDLVLMDVRMPVMDGLTATEAIRALDRRDADVPIVAMTANTFPEDIQACLNVGMNGHVAKPVDPNHLYETLLQALQL